METAQRTTESNRSNAVPSPAKPRRRFVSVEAVLSAVMRRVGWRAEDGQVQVFVDAGSGGFEGDADAVIEAFVAVVLNAVDVSPRGGAVLVSTKELPDGSQAWAVRDFVPPRSVRSCDDGDSFMSRANCTALTVARRIFESQGGELSIHSDGSAGTLISMHLPRASETGLHAAPL